MKTSIKTFTIASAFLLILSCQTPTPTTTELIAGTYYGTVTINASPSGSASAVINKVNDNSVNLIFTIGANPSVTYSGISVNDNTSPYDFEQLGASDSLYAHVDGNQLIFTVYDSGNQTTFMGNK